MDFLYAIDKAVFLFLNKSLANPVFDFIMPVITEPDYWRIPILLFLLFLLILGGRKGRITVLLLIFAVTFSDQISSFVIKPFVHRLRPCFALETARLLIDQPNSPSFPSSHAANMTSTAMILFVQYRKKSTVYLILAGLVIYSRIYVGVHYPSDVIGGIFVGLVCGFAVLEGAKIINGLINRFFRNKDFQE